MYVQCGRHICWGAYASNEECMYTSGPGDIVHFNEFIWGIYIWTYMKWLVCMCGTNVAFEGHICFWYIYGNKHGNKNLKLAGILWNRTSGWSLRQAFIYYCRLLQVWKGTRIHALICSLKCLLNMLRCMLGSVKGEKSENPKGKGEIGKWKRREIKN